MYVAEEKWRKTVNEENNSNETEEVINKEINIIIIMCEIMKIMKKTKKVMSYE